MVIFVANNNLVMFFICLISNKVLLFYFANFYIIHRNVWVASWQLSETYRYFNGFYIYIPSKHRIILNFKSSQSEKMYFTIIFECKLWLNLETFYEFLNNFEERFLKATLPIEMCLKQCKFFRSQLAQLVIIYQ